MSVSSFWDFLQLQGRAGARNRKLKTSWQFTVRDKSFPVSFHNMRLFFFFFSCCALNAWNWQQVKVDTWPNFLQVRHPYREMAFKELWNRPFVGLRGLLAEWPLCPSLPGRVLVSPTALASLLIVLLFTLKWVPLWMINYTVTLAPRLESPANLRFLIHSPQATATGWQKRISTNP